jgi:DNA-binding phage protein
MTEIRQFSILGMAPARPIPSTASANGAGLPETRERGKLARNPPEAIWGMSGKAAPRGFAFSQFKLLLTGPLNYINKRKHTDVARARRDRASRDALLTEAVEAPLSGEVDTGKAILRDDINATVGFGRLAEVSGAESKSLMRMLGPKGNPT